MKNNFKFKRINKLFGKFLSDVLIRNFTYSGNIITITCIDFNPYSNLVKVFISTFDKSDYIIKILNNSSNKIKYYLSNKTKIKKMPNLIFIYDSQDKLF